MARTLLLFALAAILVSTAWFRLEKAAAPLDDVVLIAALALLPTLAVALGRSRLVVAGVLAASTLFALSVATGIPLADASPRDGERDFFGPVVAAIGDGFLDFYETTLPFSRLDFPLMHALVLLAIFAFVALAGMFAAARRPLAVALVLLVGLGWPATILPGERPLATGALVLAGVLAVLFLVRERDRAPRGLAQAVAVGVALVLAAVGASSSSAVAKGGFLRWQAWDPYDRPEDPVGVSYVWDANYGGVAFPKKKTVVLRIRVPGPRRSLYWRATTLDEYSGFVWKRDHHFRVFAPAEELETLEADPLLPPAARAEKNWVRQDVSVEALADEHLIASAQPVKWRPGTDAPLEVGESGVTVVPDALRQGQRYTAWSYVPKAKPSELARSPGLYPPELSRYLEAFDRLQAPAFGEPGREARMAELFRADSRDFVVDEHRPLYALARNVTRRAKSPYAAAVTLEAWFRSRGGFTYDETPPVLDSSPPLVAFVLQHRRGYCQQYAGAMALMLRLLGVPARVAAGFTSGTYDSDTREWTVTDHNAHTWVEVYFPGFGWLPFDPTPGRGVLAGGYSPFSRDFNLPDADGADVLGQALGPNTLRELAGVPSGGLTARLEEQAASGASPRGGKGGARDGRNSEKPGQSLLKLGFLLLSIGVAALLAVKAVRRRLRFLARDPRAIAGACRRDLVGFLADQGLDPPASATLAELGAAVEREFVVDCASFIESATAARFGPPAEATAAIRRARRELRLLRKHVAGQLGLRRRVRGALSVRSLMV